MKRLFSALLSVALLLTLLPAAEAKSGAWDGSVDISWYDPGKSEYYLSPRSWRDLPRLSTVWLTRLRQRSRGTRAI